MAQTNSETISTKSSLIKDKRRKNFLTYSYDYYTGANARIFFGHVWVDDIVTIQYSQQQTKSPIYGYASQQFDAVAKGQILVNGNFTIAFKEVGYLTLVHNELESIKSRSEINKRKIKKNDQVLNYWLGQNKPIEQILDELYVNDFPDEESTADNYKSRDFEDLSEALEDFVWSDFDKPGTNLIRPDEFDYDSKNGGIDINGFDIVMTFGDYTDDIAEHTVKVLNDVHITGETVIVSPDGAPIALNYTFFARGTDERISNTFNIPKEKEAKKNKSVDTDWSASDLDFKVPEDFEVTIAQVKDGDGNKITTPSIIGQDFFTTFRAVKTDLYPYLATVNVSSHESQENFRIQLKNYLINILNNVNWSTFRDGLYSESCYDLTSFDFSIKFIMPREPISDIEADQRPNMDYLKGDSTPVLA